MGKQRAARKDAFAREEQSKRRKEFLAKMGYTGERNLVEVWQEGHGGKIFTKYRGGCTCGHTFTDCWPGADIYVCTVCGKEYTREGAAGPSEFQPAVWVPWSYLVGRIPYKDESLLKPEFLPTRKKF